MHRTDRTSDLLRVCICIATFKRPELLSKCLEALETQDCLHSYSVVLVDNDQAGSSREVAEHWRDRFAGGFFYAVEPEQNISLARNRAIRNANADYIALIDDDEFPSPTWLRELITARERFGVDGVLGPVLPVYEGHPPDWLVKSGLCTRSSFPTGTPMSTTKHMRTGNVLFARRIIQNEPMPFDPRLGRTGGEDAAFFRCMLAKGCSFAWCAEAEVYEVVPKSRQTRTYWVRRAMIRGVTSADDEAFIGKGTLKSLAALFLYVPSLPFLQLLGHHLFMRYFIKTLDHLAKLLAHLGVKLVHERTF